MIVTVVRRYRKRKNNLLEIMKTSLYYKVYFLTFLTMMYGYYGYDGYMPFGEHFTFLGPILMVLFWVFIIVLVVYLVRGDT